MQVGGGYSGLRPALFGFIILVHLLVLAFIFRPSVDLTRRPVRNVAPLEVAKGKTTSPSDALPRLRRIIAPIDPTGGDSDLAAQTPQASVRRSSRLMSMPARALSGAALTHWEALSFDRVPLKGISTLPPPARPQPAVAKQPIQRAFWLTRLPPAQ